MKRTIICLLLPVFLLTSSTPALAKKKAPDWVGRSSWEDSKYFYFVGVSTKSKTEEAARREAWDNAMAEAIQALFGISGRMTLTSFADLKKIQIAQDVFVSTDEVRLQAKPVDTHVERIGSSGETSYNVYRSIKVEKDETEKELKRLKSLAAKKDKGEKKLLEPSEDQILVSVEGKGVVQNDDEPQAKMAAVRNGLQQACEKLMANWFKASSIQTYYSKLDQLIYAPCPSYSKEYAVTSGMREGNLYRVRMDVSLDQTIIRRKLMDAGLYPDNF